MKPTSRTVVCSSRVSSQSGFSLLVIALTAIVMLGMIGLSFDMGRMFIIKNELQVFCDSAALGGVRNLDGTQSGVQYAHNVAIYGPLGQSLPNAMNFDTARVTTATDTYATTFTGTYDSYATAAAPATNAYRFIKVNATANVRLYFLGALGGMPGSVRVAAQAVAGQAKRNATFTNGGLVPFVPAAHDPSDLKNFGLTPGQSYTLKWGKNGTAPASNCGGDAGWPLPAFFPADRGYVDLGQGNGTDHLRKAIVFGGYPNALSVPNHVDAGDLIEEVPGSRSNPAGTALGDRSAQDTDLTSTTWEAYKASLAGGSANGRRVVTALIDDPNQSTGTGSNYTVKVIGFGNFLLYPPSVYYNGFPGSQGEYCAIYIGPASNSALSSGGQDGTSLYEVMLFN